jgi:starch synthase
MAAVIPLYIKTAYHDEPSFAESKVVTTLYESQLKNDLGENFKKCLEFREAKPELLKPYKAKFDFMELGKLAIDYSDGIIEGSQKVNDELLKYAKAKKLPLIEYPGENFAESYKAYFESLLSE